MVGSVMLQLPPQGPRGRLSTTIAVAREPFAATRRWRDQFGPTYMASVMSGRYFVTGDPEVVRDVFRANPAELYPGGVEALGPLTGPRSLFMLDPGEHGAERKILAPPFGGHRMRAYVETMQQATERQLTSLRVGERLAAIDLSRRISAEVIVRAVFGVQDPARVARYLGTITRWIDLWKPLFILFPSTQRELFGVSPWARFVRAGAELDALLLEDIERRRRADHVGEDISSLLLQTRYENGEPLEAESIRSHLRALLLAGHETTMIAIAWVLHYVLRDAAMAERMQALADGPLEVAIADEWFEAVINEALRLYPIIMGVVRVLGEQSQLGPYVAPAGTQVWVSIATLHLDPSLFPEPERFEPERFLTRSYKPYEFAPFGGGHRRCLGAAFAMLETKVAIATLLRHVTFEHLGPHEPEVARRNLSMAPACGIRLRVVGKR